MDPIKQAYKTFSNLIPWSNFQTKLALLPEKKKWRFIRSSLMYQQAMKCKKCNPNIAMSLLCSCAESLKILGTRVGSRRNFEALYLRHCPQPLRIAPMKYYPNKAVHAVPAPFSKALFYIYKKFRCLYTHEGIGRLQQLKKSGKTHIINNSLLDVAGNDAYSIDLLKVLDWFAGITKSSLFQSL